MIIENHWTELTSEQASARLVEGMENIATSPITLLSDGWAIRTPLDLNHDAQRAEYALADVALRF